MPSKLYPSNVSGILFVSKGYAEAYAYAYDFQRVQYQDYGKLKLDPGIKILSAFSDDRVIATFQANIEPGHGVEIIINYTGGFFNKKKTPWPEVWNDGRIKNLVSQVIYKVAEKAGFVVVNANIPLFDAENNW